MWLDRIASLSRDAGDRVTWHPVIAAQELLDFERTHGVPLLEDYKAVLTRFGNGCRGLVTLFPLGHVWWNNEELELDEWLPELDLQTPFPFPRHAWHRDVDEEPEDDASNDDEEDDYDDDGDKAWDAPGALPVADNHAAGVMLLVVSGPERGRMWEQDIGATVVPAPTPLVRPVGYAEWIAAELAKRLGRMDLLESWRAES